MVERWMLTAQDGLGHGRHQDWAIWAMDGLHSKGNRVGVVGKFGVGP